MDIFRAMGNAGISYAAKNGAAGGISKSSSQQILNTQTSSFLPALRQGLLSSDGFDDEPHRWENFASQSTQNDEEVFINELKVYSAVSRLESLPEEEDHEDCSGAKMKSVG